MKTVREIIEQALIEVYENHGILISKLEADYIDKSHPLSDTREYAVGNIEIDASVKKC